ncbi:chorismate-binding protein, partial [Planctomycetota bacterium]
MNVGVASTDSQTVQCRLYACLACTPIPHLDQLNAWVATLPHPAILGGNTARSPHHRYSYWAACPREIVSCTPDEPAPLTIISYLFQRYRVAEGTSVTLPPHLFKGGWIGYFGYELGRHFENLPAGTRDDLFWPLFRLGFYDKIIAYDHEEAVFWLLALHCEGDTASGREKLGQLQEWVNQASRCPVPEWADIAIPAIEPATLQSNMSQADYRAAVERILDYIRDGETYQINLSQRFRCPFSADPARLFHWQNRFNPSPFAAYLAWSDA